MLFTVKLEILIFQLTMDEYTLYWTNMCSLQ
jgi:hypothetical protein